MNLALAQSRSSKTASVIPRRFSTRSPVPAISHQSYPVPTIARCACGGSCPRCQVKSNLEIGAPDDQYERAADRVADSVMSGRSGNPIDAISLGVHPKLSRKVLQPDEKFDSIAPPEEELGPTPSDPSEELQRKASGEAGMVTPQYERSLNQAVGGGGEVLPTTTRSFMERRLGLDLSSVRVHRDAQAGRLAQEINARAFTLGNDIFFAPAQYEPFTKEGQHLLAHELTHVVQQSDGRLSRQIRRDRTRCSSYPGYDASVNRYTYNCAGLALRTYRFTSPPSAVYKEMWASFVNAVCPVGNCEPGQVKFWLWDYDIHTEDDRGTVIDPTWHDFHIVGGRVDAHGNDPTNVYSKNGQRPIHGPGTGPSFRPAAKDRALDRDDNPGDTAQGRPLYKVRSNMREEITCAECS
jgi:Domain of unknown function (DUF4157)